jgi:hypothetical protein
MADAAVETAKVVVETAALSGEVVKATVALENGEVAAKVDCCSEEWVPLAAHNLEARCAPLAIQQSPLWLLLVQSGPYLPLQGGLASAPQNLASHHPL